MDPAHILKQIVALKFVKATVQSVWLDQIVRNAKGHIGVTQVLVAEVTFNSLIRFLISCIFSKMTSLNQDSCYLILECGCSKEGSFEDSCDDVTGKCRCLQGFKGDKCEVCPNGKVLVLGDGGKSDETCQPREHQGMNQNIISNKACPGKSSSI